MIGTVGTKKGDGYDDQHTPSCVLRPSVLSSVCAAQPSERCVRRTLLVVQKLHVQERATAIDEALQQLLPAKLTLEAVAKEDVAVKQRTGVVLWQLLEPEDKVVRRGRLPPAMLHQLCSDAAIWETRRDEVCELELAV